MLRCFILWSLCAIVINGDIDACMRSPCHNDGSCFNQSGQYTCTCPDGYTGENCEIGQSPCDEGNYKRIPREGLRYVNFKITEDETPAHDFNLIPGWYYAGDESMWQKPPPMYSCGTLKPIWLHDTDPAMDDFSPKEANACVKDLDDQCSRSFTIKIQRCPDMSLRYYLKKAVSRVQGYCFGNGNRGERPTYVPPKPKVTTRTIAMETVHKVTRTIFECEFEDEEGSTGDGEDEDDSTDDGLLFQVSWLQNGDLLYTTPTVERGHDDLHLTEDVFVDRGFKLGNELSCAVRAYTVVKGPPGTLSEFSDMFYAGITILTSTLTFKKGEKDPSVRTIRLQSSVPIGCEGLSNCDIWLTVSLPPEMKDQCSGIGVQEASCGIAINSAKYSDVHEIIVEATETGQYITKDLLYNVYLKTDKHTDMNLIWNDYQLPPVKVQVLKPNSTLTGYEGKRCGAQSDPHMTTFDGKRYDNHDEGEFILYRHSTFDAEIQIKHEPCNSDSIMCVCGLAVRAGKDLYVMSVCDRKVNIGYQHCEDEVLDVKSTNELNYKVFMPHGTYVNVRINVIANPRPGHGDRTLEIFVIPSSFDVDGQSRGLCGLLDISCDNDYHDRGGNAVGNDEGCGSWGRSNQPMDFINKWKVTSPSENMFSDQFDFAAIEHWPLVVCVCDSKDDMDGRIPCNKNSVATCIRGKPVGKHSCEEPGRRRRSVKRSPKIPIVSLLSSRSSHHNIDKREDNPGAWTLEKAKTFCESYTDQLPVYSLCSKVPSVEPYHSVEQCIADIQITLGTEWVGVNMENMQEGCLSELRRNVTLRQAEEGKVSIAEKIEVLACPRNCSSSGICHQGKCECNPGLGGADCSMDMTKGPTISGILDDGFCDEQLLPCDHAYVFGHIFTDSTELKCRLHAFTMSQDGVRAVHTTHHVSGEFETMIEVQCPLTAVNKQLRSTPINRDAFVYGYTVSVSNAGDVFEAGKDLFIYDSACQTPTTEGGITRFSLVDNFCFIELACIAQGEHHANDSCMICDTRISTSKWSFNIDNRDCDGAASAANTPALLRVCWVFMVLSGLLWHV